VAMLRHLYVWRFFVLFLVFIGCTTVTLVAWSSIDLDNVQPLQDFSLRVSTDERLVASAVANYERKSTRLSKVWESNESTNRPQMIRNVPGRHLSHRPIQTFGAGVGFNRMHSDVSRTSDLTLSTGQTTKDESIDSALRLLTGAEPLNNEFEVSPFIRFYIDRLYPVEPGLGRRVIEKPIGYRKREILAVIDQAVNFLNENNSTGKTFSTSNFIEGMYRIVPSGGTHYELFFRDGSRYRKIVIALPYAQSVVVESDSIATKKDTIHIILPLSGRVDSFRNFMKRYERLYQNDDSISLTVVYFNSGGLAEIRSIVANFTLRHRSSGAIVRVVSVSGAFSRGKGLQTGVDSVGNGSSDPLLFLCDVDIAFTTGFLERCRVHSVKGRSIYYPIVFSLYNPAVIATLNGTGPSADQPIGREAGFWRDFGYGMTCQYRSDFLRVGGFAADSAEEQSSLSGWGMEDVRLYRRHLQSGRVTVIRATDPGIFHMWHEKHCDPSLPSSQYTGCLRSKALSEASHAQLGMLLFRSKPGSKRATTAR
jgi:chondroitin sulfate N-acetylgalactosaminyltransferase 1/2